MYDGNRLFWGKFYRAPHCQARFETYGSRCKANLSGAPMELHCKQCKQHVLVFKREAKMFEEILNGTHPSKILRKGGLHLHIITCFVVLGEWGQFKPQPMAFGAGIYYWMIHIPIHEWASKLSRRIWADVYFFIYASLFALTASFVYVLLMCTRLCT